MSNSTHPIIHVTIKPMFNHLHHVESLSISLSVKSYIFKTGDTILSSQTAHTKRTDTDMPDRPVTDELGDFPMEISHPEPYTTKSCIASRDSSGDVNIFYKACPATRKKMADWDQPSAIDLKYDQGCIIGTGFSFIPLIAGDEDFRTVVEWNLDASPKGTRAVWTYGEGPDPIEKIGPASVLLDSVYMIGPINSTPPSTPPSEYGSYYFGTLPPNISLINDIHFPLFTKTASFFNTPPPLYRSFTTLSPLSRTTHSTPLPHAHILTYTPQIHLIDDYTLIRRLTHSLLHPYLPPSWLGEGIKHLLSIYLPFRPPGQVRDGSYFQDTVNVLVARYYTSPYLRVSMDRLLRLAEEEGDKDAHEHAGVRGWAYVLSVDLAARKVVPVTKPPQRPVEDLAVKPLVAGGRDWGIEEFIRCLTPLMGAEPRERYERMCEGTPILFPVELFGAKSHRLVPVQQEVFELGMERQAFEGGVVKGLKGGCRAEVAGVREGDEVVWKEMGDGFEGVVEVGVMRGEERLEFKWWPRGWERVESWRLEKVEDS
ncbi:trypsin-like serine typically contains c-terminal pdz protein [Glarea lozoyensis ATCC 20868]|uniref:Trypsin-like serine typically contains c-terminal pdz protein n=1 Tax=Glarea lozoyensis (strain ATCC 20868 / MF5171) TaxID=1116229 RepID=S3DE54_GLAL2|nr:trypsin-like serine typically contains c-terminal pdz protein [Glarea lozoyensis ATCC 20868]EPE30251.1 trypsin-like serine typically contains c-terminal pdz protein [Glarea lozoyensis ATCC 20868]